MKSCNDILIAFAFVLTAPFISCTNSTSSADCAKVTNPFVPHDGHTAFPHESISMMYPYPPPFMPAGPYPYSEMPSGRFRDGFPIPPFPMFSSAEMCGADREQSRSSSSSSFGGSSQRYSDNSINPPSTRDFPYPSNQITFSRSPYLNTTSGIMTGKPVVPIPVPVCAVPIKPNKDITQQSSSNRPSENRSSLDLSLTASEDRMIPKSQLDRYLDIKLREEAKKKVEQIIEQVQKQKEIERKSFIEQQELLLRRKMMQEEQNLWMKKMSQMRELCPTKSRGPTPSALLRLIDSLPTGSSYFNTAERDLISKLRRRLANNSCDAGGQSSSSSQEFTNLSREERQIAKSIKKMMEGSQSTSSGNFLQDLSALVNRMSPAVCSSRKRIVRNVSSSVSNVISKYVGSSEVSKSLENTVNQSIKKVITSQSKELASSDQTRVQNALRSVHAAVDLAVAQVNNQYDGKLLEGDETKINELKREIVRNVDKQIKTTTSSKQNAQIDTKVMEKQVEFFYQDLKMLQELKMKVITQSIPASNKPQAIDLLTSMINRAQQLFQSIPQTVNPAVSKLLPSRNELSQFVNQVNDLITSLKNDLITSIKKQVVPTTSIRPPVLPTVKVPLPVPVMVPVTSNNAFNGRRISQGRTIYNPYQSTGTCKSSLYYPYGSGYKSQQLPDAPYNNAALNVNSNVAYDSIPLNPVDGEEYWNSPYYKYYQNTQM